MTERLTRISPWQTAKTLAAFYFAVALIVGIPIGVAMQLIPDIPGQEKPGFLIFLALPFLYGIVALIFVPLVCWLYNVIANMVGGIEYTSVESSPDA